MAARKRRKPKNQGNGGGSVWDRYVKAVDVAELWQKKRTQRAIAAELGISRSTVCTIIKRAEAWYRDQAGITVEERVRREERTLELIERESWKAWEKSLLGRAIGEPRHLVNILSAVAQKARFRGLNAPEKLNADMVAVLEEAIKRAEQLRVKGVIPKSYVLEAGSVTIQ